MKPKFVWVEVAPGRQRLVPADSLGKAPVEKVAGVFVVRNTLTAAERRSLSRLTGEKIQDMSHARRVMAEKGLRFVERGDAAYKTRQDLKDWHESSRDPARRGPAPGHSLNRPMPE